MFYKEYIFLVTHFYSIKDNPPYLSGGTNMGFCSGLLPVMPKNKDTSYGPITKISLSAKQ